MSKNRKKSLSIIIVALTIAVLFSGCDRKERDARPQIEEAVACMKNNDFDCSIKLLEKTTRTYENADVWLLLGESYRGKREATPLEAQWLPKETAALEKSVSLNGNNIDSLKYLAEAYFAGGDFQKAKENYLRVLSLKPPEYEAKDIQSMINQCNRIIAQPSAPPPPTKQVNPGDATDVPQ